MHTPEWDIFCNVIDNFGDIGVSWRLARQLRHEHGMSVRLWVDDLACFNAIETTIDPLASRQELQGVTVLHWQNDIVEKTQPADIVIEAFGCRLPDSYMGKMATRTIKPVWINLEYLSAEQWVEDCHGLASPHPQLPLVKYFFFPGFTPRTGGLPCEASLYQQRQQWQQDASLRDSFWQQLGLTSPLENELCISLFCYEMPAMAGWLHELSQRINPTRLLVPVGKVIPDLAKALQIDYPLTAGHQIKCGQLSIHILPMTDQQQYDRLLWSCDLNIVRGEDSFLRAQWAGRPMLWHIYRQDDDAHLIKLEAFLDHYLAGMPEKVAHAIRGWWHDWNGSRSCEHSWQQLSRQWPDWRSTADSWPQKLLAGGDLATRLVQFAEKKLQ